MEGKQQEQRSSRRERLRRGLQRQAGHQEQRQRQRQRQPLTMLMFVCLTLLQYFCMGMIIAPVAIMGRRTNAATATSTATATATATAFVATTKSFRGGYFAPSKIKSYNHAASASSKTKLFFDHNKHHHHRQRHHQRHQEQRTNSTGMQMMEGIAAVAAVGTTTRPNNESPTKLSASSSSYIKVYCDMDGCLVNFEKGVRMLLNTGSSTLDKRVMWEGISQAPLWFEQLEWQMDGKRLWSAIKHLNPDILTGVPDIESSRIQKFNWCKRELGLEDTDAHHVDMAADGLTEEHKSVNGNFPREDKTNVITCWSNNKYKECNRRGS